MATGKLAIDEGTTSNLATYTFTEDAVTKHINRSVLSTSAGVEISPATAANQSTANTSLASIDTKTLATPATIRNGKVTVTTAGTRVQVSGSSVAVVGVVLQALAGNTGKVYVGDSLVASTNGFELQPGQAIGLAIDNLNKIYIDSAVNGEGVVYLGS